MTLPTRQILPLTSIALFALATIPSASASFVDREEVRTFVEDIATRHNLDHALLLDSLSRARHEPRVISLIRPPSTPGVRSWQRYRARFLDKTRIEGGLAFWSEYAPILKMAEERYGVPAEVIVAIIGVETVYGRHTGNFETLSALTTLAFDYPPRAELFRRELENLFLLAREQNRPPESYLGSYAGALGFPQFLPSSVRHYAVDFDADGKIDFDSSPLDAIGSVANYLHVHGWQTGAPVAVMARLGPETDPAPLVAAGIEPSLSPAVLSAAGIGSANGNMIDANATLVDLVTPGAATEYWLGYRNFYVITRYNKSSFYAMSVFELAETLRQRRNEELAKR